MTGAGSETVNVALVGLNNPHSRIHLRTLQALPEVGRVFIWDEDEAALAGLKQEAKVAAVSGDLDAVVGRDDALLAVIATRNDAYLRLCLRALEAGRHVLAEKPVGLNAAEVEQVVRAADKARRQLGVFYTNRASPMAQQARDIVGRGLLGPLMSVEMRMLTTQVNVRNPQHWLFSKALSGGGMASWLGSHYLDLMRYVSHDEIVSVSAEVATRSGEAIDVEDVATISVRFRSGAIGSLHTGYVLVLRGGGYENKGGYDTHIGFYGQMGRVVFGLTPGLQAESIHPDWASAPFRDFQYTIANSTSYGGISGEQFVRRFIQAAQGRGEPVATGRDALQVARILDAAYESSRTGRRLEIAPPPPLP